ncbi:pentapeptide repeat protein [Tamaricihabitans halophyticus]|uniref:Pentapeptide repeat protein n=1 Tax=Tamaricihabitans halophyticus TaxID=1262583 RepID=A0A4R2Q8D1_9PSEU|nr:pentapeptide repeat-containing protein [Tamaricihabitans halophyticus]TCP45070.1 pentapeptide repeat protein [Tamaricihabitans halophyticus]
MSNPQGRIGLLATISTAVAALICVSVGLLVFDPSATGADALRTGGLAAGSVVALYALWLNDRRRRVDEQRQQLDNQRNDLETQRYQLERERQQLEDRKTDQEHSRAADERFARSVEILGNEADQVRVGAMHALAGLARSHREYTQTVLDVLCSYLRRPFDHPYWDLRNRDDAQTVPEHSRRERTVRQTAAKLIASLLPSTDAEQPEWYSLDVAGANLDRFDLSDRVVGSLNASGCRFRHTTSFAGTVFLSKVDLREVTFLHSINADGAVFQGTTRLCGLWGMAPASFAGTTFRGEVDLRSARFADHATFRLAVLHGQLDLRYAHFDGGVDLRVREPAPTVSLYHTEVDTSIDVHLPRSWELTEHSSPNRAYIWIAESPIGRS